MPESSLPAAGVRTSSQENDMEYLGWLVAIGLGIGWWLDHRGMAGIKSDLADAKREIKKRRG